MMYFSRLKTGIILGICLLGALLCIPNFLPAPVSWLPWRTVHLGLDPTMTNSGTRVMDDDEDNDDQNISRID